MKRKKTYTKEEAEKLLNIYLTTNRTIESIYAEYGWVLKRLFKEYGLNARKSRAGRYKLKWMADSITNEFEAYFIGFMFADGYISSNSQVGIKLKNQESEVKLLNQFIDYIIPEQTIKLTRDDKIASLVISSNDFCENIQKLGVLKNKTYEKLSIPEMEKYLIPHFIRGYFDGDGTVFYDRKYLRSNICSIDKNFLQQLQEILTSYNIITTITTEKRKGKKFITPQGKETYDFYDMHRLNISSKSIHTEFKDFLYSNATIFLNRKKEMFFKDNPEINLELKNSKSS